MSHGLKHVCPQCGKTAVFDVKTMVDWPMSLRERDKPKELVVCQCGTELELQVSFRVSTKQPNKSQLRLVKATK